MTPELERYYEELMETFQTPGWQHVQSKMEEILQLTQEQGWDDTNDNLPIHKGFIRALKYFVNFREQHEDAFDQLRNQPDEDVPQ